jgi:hypothetical protein
LTWFSPQQFGMINKKGDIMIYIYIGRQILRFFFENAAPIFSRVKKSECVVRKQRLEQSPKIYT